MLDIRIIRMKNTETSSTLLDALNFAKIAYMEEGEAYQTHIILHGKRLFAYNGTIAVGTPIEEEITACPQGHTLRLALVRCKGAFAMGVEGDKLQVRSGRFRASIPCLDFGAVRAFQADPPSVAVGEGLKAAFNALEPLVAVNGATVLESALALSSMDATATNRQVIGQYWHGYELPRTFLLPRAAIDAVRNAPSDLVSLGYSYNSVTFHFADNSWIRSQLYHDEKYPDIGAMFPTNLELTDLAEGFTEGVVTLAPFDKDDKAIFYSSIGLEYKNGKLSSSVEVDGIPGEVAFLAHNWLLLGKRMTKVDWLSDKKAVHMQGPGMRGIMLKMAIMPVYKGKEEGKIEDENDIPF
jgi:hypothetical protein